MDKKIGHEVLKRKYTLIFAAEILSKVVLIYFYLMLTSGSYLFSSGFLRSALVFIKLLVYQV